MALNEVVIGEDEVPTYVPALPVPNVQEMVRKNPLNIPERYIRSPEEMPISNNVTNHDIPVIDLSLLSNGQEEELKKLDIACKEWGFFQVINHGMAEENLRSMKNTTDGFFDLPLDEKTKYAKDQYDIQGYGHAFVASEEQKLDWLDMLILIIYPSRYRKPKFWPSLPVQFKEITEAYSAEIKRVGEELLGSLSLIMGLEKDELLNMHKELLQALRINYYPSCARPDQVLGVSPHTDASTITILLQGDDVDGLQVLHDGEWVLVRPIPNAFIVNVGDIIEILSNGKYKSVEHRAVTNRIQPRMSFATFLYPHDDVEIKPFEHLIDYSSTPRRYKNVRAGDYLRLTMKHRFQGKRYAQLEKE